jgi:hypothetical protein
LIYFGRVHQIIQNIIILNLEQFFRNHGILETWDFRENPGPTLYFAGELSDTLLLNLFFDDSLNSSRYRNTEPRLYRSNMRSTARILFTSIISTRFSACIMHMNDSFCSCNYLKLHKSHFDLFLFWKLHTKYMMTTEI